MKKLLSLILVLFIMISASACSFKKHKLKVSNEEEFNKIITAIENKDREGLKSLFSKYALNKIDNIDRKLDELIYTFPGKIEKYEIKDLFDRHSKYSDITHINTPYVNFTSNGKEYRMRYIFYTECDSDADKLGLYLVQLYERNNSSYSPNMYMHGVNDDPDILLWDYTKKSY